MRPATLVPVLIASSLLTSCDLFDGVYYPDRSRAVVKVETRGGVEYGAATEFGVLTLGRTAKEGPARVHYFLGEQLVIEDAELYPMGGVFYEARMDLKHPAARIQSEPLDPEDELFALKLNGKDVEEVELQLARGDGLDGDLLDLPGTELPVGTPIFRRVEDAPFDDDLRFVGLVAGFAELTGSNPRKLVVFAGTSRLSDALQRPTMNPHPTEVHFRRDDIFLRRRSVIEQPTGSAQPTGNAQ